MNRSHLLVLVVALAVVLTACAGLADGGKATPTKGVMVAQAPGGGGGGAAARADRMAQMRAQMMERLKAAGATDADLAAIEAFQTERAQVTRDLMQKLLALRQASEATATDEQAKTAVADYLDAAKTAADKVKQMEDKLKADLALDTKPKLHAALLVAGTLTEGAPGGGRGFFGGMGRGGARGGGGGGGGAAGG